jgi:hypothetical protein
VQDTKHSKSIPVANGERINDWHLTFKVFEALTVYRFMRKTFEVCEFCTKAELRIKDLKG